MTGVCILNYNDAETTLILVEKISNYSIIDHIVIVDNYSTDDSYDRLKSIKNKKVNIIQSKKNGGYGSGNNIGVKYLVDTYACDYVVICNPDVSFEEQCIQVCVDFLMNNTSAVCVAPQMLDRKGDVVRDCVWPITSGLTYLCFSLAIIGRFFKTTYKELGDGNIKNVDCVAGSLLIIDSAKFIDSGMYDEKLFLYCEETTLGIRFKKKQYYTYFLPQTVFVHLHSVSISKSFKKEIARKRLMWDSRLYVMKEYYNWNVLQMMFAKTIRFIALCEEWIKELVKKHE